LTSSSATPIDFAMSTIVVSSASAIDTPSWDARVPLYVPDASPCHWAAFGIVIQIGLQSNRFAEYQTGRPGRVLA
jgi:hypothetical protein